MLNYYKKKFAESKYDKNMPEYLNLKQISQRYIDLYKKLKYPTNNNNFEYE